MFSIENRLSINIIKVKNPSDKIITEIKLRAS